MGGLAGGEDKSSFIRCARFGLQRPGPRFLAHAWGNAEFHNMIGNVTSPLSSQLYIIEPHAACNQLSLWRGCMHQLPARACMLSNALAMRCSWCEAGCSSWPSASLLKQASQLFAS